MKGKLIVIEGLDGAGKGAVIGGLGETPGLVARLQTAGKEVLVLREPGGTRIGEHIRALLKDPTFSEMDARTEALLFAASRAQLAHEVIRPALAAGKWVLCDRYVLSSLAYQGWARELGIEEVRNLSMFALGDLWPNLTLLLTVSEDEAARRRAGDTTRGDDRFDSAGEDFFALVAEGYRQAMAGSWDESCVTVEADGPPAEVIALCLKEITDRGWLEQSTPPRGQ